MVQIEKRVEMDMWVMTCGCDRRGWSDKTQWTNLGFGVEYVTANSGDGTGDQEDEAHLAAEIASIGVDLSNWSVSAKSKILCWKSLKFSPQDMDINELTM